MATVKKPAAKKVAAKKKAAPAKKAGRPSQFSDTMAKKIVTALSRKSLNQVCAMNGMPNRATVQRWIESIPEFATECARAREAHADYIVDQTAAIEDKAITGKIKADVARVVISSKQWRASKLHSRKYGNTLGLGAAEDLPPLPAPAQTTEVNISIAAGDAYLAMLKKSG